MEKTIISESQRARKENSVTDMRGQEYHDAVGRDRVRIPLPIRQMCKSDTNSGVNALLQ